MRYPNGYGGIYHCKDKRRKPWRVRVTAGWEFDEILMKHKQVIKDLGYFATRQEAIKALAEYNDNPFSLDYLNITFGECFEQAKKKFTPSRRNNYIAAYKYLEALTDIPIRKVKTYHMQKCIDACTTTQQGEIKICCHKIFDYAMELEILTNDPSRKLKSVNPNKQKEREILKSDEINKLELIDEWWSKIVRMLLYSGMRTKELHDLVPDNIDTESRTVDIQIAKNKSSIRKIPIHAHVLPLFCDYKAAGCNLYGYTHDGLNKALKAFCGHTAHDCRHTFATRMKKCGCDPLLLQLILGHTPPTITERVYTHITMEELADAVNSLDYGISL